MDNKVGLVIAIDGFSSCGKSTLAKALAKNLHYVYVDTGAMYRAVTLYLLRHKVSLADKAAVQSALPNINIEFKNRSGQMITYLNGDSVEDQIRTMEVSSQVSQVAAISSVRTFLVAQQQKMGETGGIVMDGRDIATVVFPNADFKFFITADPAERVRRRFEELRNKNVDISLNDVQQNLSQRDRIDSTREDSPLRKAADAIEIDNTFLSVDDQIVQIMEIIHQKFPNNLSNMVVH